MLANQNSRQSFNSVAGTTSYNFTISYFEGEAEERFKIYLNDVLLTLGADYTINETPAIDGLSPGGELVLSADPGNGVDNLEVRRFTPRTQESDFSGTTFPAESVEKTFDRVVMISQEIADELTAAGITPSPVVSPTNVVPDWAPGEDYETNELVINENGLFRVTMDHTSTTFSVDLTAGKLESVGTFGIKGDKGDPGNDGADGADSSVPGPQGPAGADGVDGIFSQIASQGEAELGADNAKGMTPLRTAQAIAEQVPNLTVITDIEADVAQNQLDIGDLATRQLLLEMMIESAFGIWAGQQTLLNAAGPIDILGDAGSGGGSGKPLRRDGDGTRHAVVMISIERVSDAERRFSSFHLIMQYVDNQWFIKRDKTHVLDNSLEVDGVTLTVNNLPGKQGQIQYTTDNMGGVYNVDESKIKWKGVELSEV